jgi:hypothetical protein
MFKLLLIAEDLLLRFRKNRKRRNNDAWIEANEHGSQPVEILGFTFYFPTNTNRSVFISGHCFNCELKIAILDELVEYVGRFFLDFFNTTYEINFTL